MDLKTPHTNIEDMMYCEPEPSIFSTLNDEQVKVLNSNRFEVSFNSGETIFKQGSALTHIVYFKAGKAKMVLEDANGQSVLFKIVKQYDIAGGPGFYTDYRNYFSLIAIEDTKACFIDVEIFKNFVETNSSFASALISYLNFGFIKMYDQLRAFTNKHMNGRLADTLLYLSNDIYCNNEFTTTLSRLDLANMSSMTKESVIRTLKNFKEDGIIDFKNDSFKILKKDILLDISKKG